MYRGREWKTVWKSKAKLLNGHERESGVSAGFLIKSCKRMEVLLVDLVLGVTEPKWRPNHSD